MPERPDRPPEENSEYWDLLEKLEDEQSKTPIAKRNDERGRRIAASIAAMKKVVATEPSAPKALTKSQCIVKASDLLERMVALRGRLPLAKQAGGSGSLIDYAIQHTRLYIDSLNGFKHDDGTAAVGKLVDHAQWLASENEALKKVAAEATEVIKDVLELRRGEAAELAEIRKNVQKILAMPVPGRTPYRNVGAITKAMEATPSRDADTLRKAAAGAPANVRDYLLNEAKAIERN
jgi:hypothetical protein